MKFENLSYGMPDGVEEIMAKAFIFDETSFPLNQVYNDFKAKFHEIETSDHYILKRNKFIPKTFDSEFQKAFYNSDYTIGIDIPIVISKKGEVKGTVFIVGEDPLRNGDYGTQNRNSEIICSTPYGTHYSKYRDDKKTRKYWEFAMHLLNSGYSIYYTDINKIWIGAAQQRKRKIPPDLQVCFNACLEGEINKYQPKIIITFGKKAKHAVIKLHDYAFKSQKVLSLIHPTPTAYGSWKKQYGIISEFDKNVLELMKAKFDEFVI